MALSEIEMLDFKAVSVGPRGLRIGHRRQQKRNRNSEHGCPERHMRGGDQRKMSVVVVAFVLGLSSPMLVAGPQSQGKVQQKELASCWPGGQETQNPNSRKHRPSRLPPALAKARVQRSVMLLKLCISERGDVARVLVLESSGNPDVDNYYSTELSKWTFTPAQRDNKKVPTVSSVAITLYVK
jgi:hypothetical protein